MYDLLKLFIDFTPTKKDDQILQDAEQFLNQNKHLIGTVLSLAFQVLRAKSKPDNNEE